VSDWLDLARAVDAERLEYPLANSSALKILRNVAKEGVADPKPCSRWCSGPNSEGSTTPATPGSQEYQKRVSAGE